LDDGPLELRKDAHHLKQGAPCWDTRIKALLVEIEVAALRVQLAQKAQQID